MNWIKSLFLLLCLIQTVKSTAQKDTIYLNACDQIVKNKSEATYYKVFFSRKNFEQHEEFYLNGAKKRYYAYKKLPYRSENEIAVTAMAMINNKKITTQQSTTKSLDSMFFRNGTYMEWYETGSIKTKASYLAGKLHGTLETYYPNEKNKRQDVYQIDTLKSSLCFDSLGNTIKSSPFYTKAEYIKGEREMFTVLANNIKYSKEARENRLGGTVLVEFTICSDGNIDNIHIQNSVSKELDEECLRVVKLLKKWKPAQREGENVASIYTLPIKFKLE